jgi:hypothetical protein
MDDPLSGVTRHGSGRRLNRRRTMTYRQLNALEEGTRYDIVGCPDCDWRKTDILRCYEHSKEN